MKNKKFVIAFISLMTPVLTLSESSGPHGGTVVSAAGQQMEVSIVSSMASSETKVHVYVLKRNKTFPGAIGISLLDSKGNKTLLELKTIDPNQHPLLYSNSLTGGSQSYVGFELKVPFKKEKPLVIHSTDLVKH